MKISVVPLYETEMNNIIFRKDRLHNQFFYLKQELEKAGHIIATVDLIPIKQADFIILFNLNAYYLWKIICNKKTMQAVYIALEPPAVYPWYEATFLKELTSILPYIMTWQDDLIDEKNFFKIRFPYYYLETQAIIPFQKKKLMTMVIGNKQSSHPQELYTKRVEMIRFFEETCPQDFDFYGTGWDQSIFKSYKGQIVDKFKVISHYKFAICFENQVHINGYITEKIFDCFKARVVPIYLGPDNITDYVSKEAFIDYRKFKNNGDLFFYLQNLSEESYNQYLSAAETYLQTENFQKFFLH